MNFELNEEQQQIKMSVREFAESEIKPHVMEWDETQHFPIELRPKLAELGLLGVIFPEQYGGAGMGYVEYATIIEEIARVDGSVGLSVAAHNSLCSNHIYMFGTEEQKQKYLVPLAQGESFGAWGLTEAQAGSDSAGTRTNAVRENGHYKVNGSKNFITHAISCETLVAVAVTDKSKGNKGISAFIFDKSMEGFRSDKKENKLGMRASETASVVFEDCSVPQQNLLGNEGEGFTQAMKILDGGRISIAALSVGIAQGAFEAAVKYAKERHQFGQPIAEFQAIQFKLADMATQIEAARLLTMQAALMKDAGKNLTKQSAMAKLYASEVAVRVSEESIQIHGGYGYTKDYPAEKYWRDSKLCTIGEGTSEIQRMVIAKQTSFTGSSLFFRRVKHSFVARCTDETSVLYSFRSSKSKPEKEEFFMSLSENLIGELQYEAATTRKCLERIPEDKYDWKPHEKSMAMGRLATHIAEMVGWVKDTVEKPELDFATMDYKPFEPKTTGDLVAFLDKNVADANESLKNASDETLLANWKMRNGEKIFVDMPRIAVLRGLVMKHIVHHRGQLSVYLRLNDIPVPEIYGPSADEGSM